MGMCYFKCGYGNSDGDCKLFYTAVLFETFMPLNQLIASFGELLPFIQTKLDVVLFNALPFNILKGMIIGAITMMIYKKLTLILKGRNLK